MAAELLGPVVTVLGWLGVVLVVAVVVGRRVFPPLANGRRPGAPAWTPARQRVIVTGASSGIGRAVAVQWARAGAQLVLSARSADALAETKAMCLAAVADSAASGGGGGGSGGAGASASSSSSSESVVTVVADMGLEADCRRVVAACVSSFGGVDALVLNAGVSQSGLMVDAVDADIAALKGIIDVNVNQVMYMTLLCMPHLAKDDAGVAGKRVCLIGSVAGKLGLPSRSIYSMTKFALQGFADALRLECELRPKTRHIGVTLICPGPVDTGINDRRHALGGADAAAGALPMPPGTLSADGAATKISAALAQAQAEDIWMPAAKHVPFLGYLIPGSVPRLMLRTTVKQFNLAPPAPSTTADKKET